MCVGEEAYLTGCSACISHQNVDCRSHYFPHMFIDSCSIADHLLQHLYRWLSSPSSQLHHPTLHRAVNGLMGKLFAQLVAELRR